MKNWDENVTFLEIWTQFATPASNISWMVWELITNKYSADIYSFIDTPNRKSMGFEKIKRKKTG